MDELERELRNLGERIRAASPPPPVATVRGRYRRRQAGRGAAATLLGSALVTSLLVGVRLPFDDRPSLAASTTASPEAPPLPSPPTTAGVPSLRPLPPPVSPSPTRVSPSRRPVPPVTSRPPTPAPPAPPRGTAPSCRGDLLDADLDDGSTAGFDRQDYRTDQISVVPNPAGGTGRVARVELSPEDYPPDPGGVAAQLEEDDAGSPTADRDRCFSFSTYLPRDWVGGPADILFDIHAHATEGCEGARSPVLALVVLRNRMTWGNRWDSRACTPDDESEGRASLLDAPVRRGEWVDWVVRVRWSFTSDGLLEIWENGRLLVRRTGPNAYNDAKGFYLEIGDSAYGGFGTAGRRVSYFDDVRMGTGSIGP